MNKEFVMRGQTASGQTEVLNFSGNKPGYAYRMTEFIIYPGAAVGTTPAELAASVTAAKVLEDPSNPDFNNEGLIAVTQSIHNNSVNYSTTNLTVVNDTFLITQDLILAVIDTQAGSPMAVNWQCRFIAEKLNNGEEAVTNFRQFNISSD